MKRGFALLETMIVITFLSVSLLMLYTTFTNMIRNGKKNILYDDVAHIYQAYFVKEYLMKENLAQLFSEEDIREITCDDFQGNGCQILLSKLHIHAIFLSKYDLLDYDKKKYTSSLNQYLGTLSNNGEEKYRLILEFMEDDVISYASIGI